MEKNPQAASDIVDAPIIETHEDHASSNAADASVTVGQQSAGARHDIHQTRGADLQGINQAVSAHRAGGSFSAEERFRAAMNEAGINPPSNIEADGEFHRFSTKPGKGDTAGWYMLRSDRMFGAYGCWRSGLQGSWSDAESGALTLIEKQEIERHQAEARKQLSASTESKHAEAAIRARNVWDAAEPAVSHPYLERKQLTEAFGSRVDSAGNLIIPVSGPDGLQSLQTIRPDGDMTKLFQKGGKTKGGFCWLRPMTEVDDQGAPIILAEGFATAGSIAMAMAWPVICSFTANNLLAVARDLGKQYPARSIVVAGDDDTATNGNPGRTKATAAAKAVGGTVVFPPRGGDWNDLHVAEGIEALCETFETELRYQAVNTRGEQREQRERPAISAGLDVPADKDASGTTGTGWSISQAESLAGSPDLPEAPISQPGFHVLDDWHIHGGEKLKPGVWRVGFDQKTRTFQYAWICSPLHAVATTSSEHENDYGLLLGFKNRKGAKRQWSMPMRMLKGSGEDLRGELLDLGVLIDPSNRSLLAKFLMSRFPEREITAVSSVGWHGDTFVFPDDRIGDDDVVFQSESACSDEFLRGGTAAGWQQEIAAFCAGNTVLMVSVAAALAGPLLHLVHRQNGGGIHWMGDSSTGKSTAVEVAASVWGSPDFVRSWSTTANGLEGVAASRNDTCLILDEISEASPSEVGRIVYMLTNGQGKQRADRSGHARQIHRWRLMTLSTGERSMAAVMSLANQKPNAGQLVRLLTIPVAGFRYGAFQELHGLADGRAFSDHMKQARAQNYGHLGPAFIRQLIQEKRDLSQMLAPLDEAYAAKASTSLEKRAATIFAVIALAGELATEYGLLPWKKDSASDAAESAFDLWREASGQPASEDQQILENVSEFIGRFGDSRFSALQHSDGMTHHDEQRSLNDRAGWYKAGEPGRAYLFLGPALKEAGGGFDPKRVIQALNSNGWITERDHKRLTKKVRTPAGLKNLYHVSLPEDAL